MTKNKYYLAAISTVLATTALAGCVETKDDAENNENVEAGTIEILGMASSEADMNILRDQ